jgi:hypothetical protein
MSVVEKPILLISISDRDRDNEECNTIPYTTSPLDTFRGGKGFQAQRKKKDAVGDGKKNKKTAESGKSYERH